MVQQFFKRKFPYGFLLIICLIIIFLYIMFVHVLLINIHPWSQPATIVFLVFYHLIFILLVWSIIQSIKTDPGKVPAQWGFQIDNRQKKYCLICHVFKPDRTHHCSTCNRCVLNMDHHCPWINSCIGFYNRKAFILMLFYTTVMTFFNILIGILSIHPLTEKPQQEQQGMIGKLVFVAIAFILNIVIFIAILNFLHFHLNLIFSNYTTLEILELKRQRKDENQTPSKYDIGNYYNWVQVFGRNWVRWPIPIFLSDDGPSGDGVLWPISNDQNQMRD